MKHFIKTTDEKSKQNLLNMGFQIIDEKNGVTTFLNDESKPILFDKSKISFTNVLIM